MENNNKPSNEIQVELSEEMAQGTYANLAIISHSTSEFILDLSVWYRSSEGTGESRVILTPDNAKRLFFALQDNLAKYEEQLKGGNKTANFEDLFHRWEAFRGKPDLSCFKLKRDRFNYQKRSLFNFLKLVCVTPSSC